MPLTFTILGPVRFRRGGADIELGGRQQRIVLALMLARAGAVVSIAELVDVVWGDDPPTTAANGIHRAVGNLRRLIEPDLPVREPGRYLVRHAGGYRLRLDEDMLDLLRFRALANRASHAAGDTEAVHHYAAALALWHGPPAADLERTHPILVALETELAHVARDAADAALRCGTSALILADLLRITGWRPLDEGLQARLVLALAAAGRQSEALDTARQVRARLADRLGIDTGAELADAYRRVLRQTTESVDAAPPTASVSDLVRLPAQLPPDHPFFCGRERVVAYAEALLADDRRQGRGVTLAVDGMPGVGKTTLAVHLAHRLTRAYPDGQLYVDLRGFTSQGTPMSTWEALRGFLSSLGVRGEDRPAELHAAAGLYRSLLADHRVLVVLDNARDVEQIRHLLPGTPGCLALVTSRTRMTGLIAGGAHPLELELPGADEAHDYFRCRLGRERVAAEPRAVDRIVELCGRLPLAMAIVATRALAMPDARLTDIAQQLVDPSDRLGGFDDGTPDDLRAVFSWSYRALSSAAARLFRLLPLADLPEITPDVAARLAGTDTATARRLLAELSVHMLTQVRGDRYQVHDLVRAFAAGRSDDEDAPQDRAEAMARLRAPLARLRAVS